MHLPDLNNLGGIGTVALFAAGGAIATFWGQVKAFFQRLKDYIIVVIKIEDGALNKAVCSFCFSKLKRSPIGVRTYSANNIFVRPRRRRESVPMEIMAGQTLLFWRGFRPLWVTSGTISFIRFTWNPDKLIIEASDFQNHLNSVSSKTYRRFSVSNVVGRNISNAGGNKNSDFDSIHYKNVRILKWKHEHLGAPISDIPPIEFLSLSKDCMNVAEEARHWRKSRDWYKERGIPWKRGFLFYGRPGTGKTSLARAIAEDLDMPVYVIDLASMSNDDMYWAYNYMLQTSPCMIVFEDIDGVFEGRVNVIAEKRVGKPTMTFDCLLNCIDGMEKADGVITIITTNNLHKLDPAIGGCPEAKDGKPVPNRSPRPGRIDRLVYFDSPNEAGLYKIARRILINAPEQVIDAVVRIALLKKDSPVQFQDRCGLIALTMKWNKQRLALKQFPVKKDPLARFKKWKEDQKKKQSVDPGDKAKEDALEEEREMALETDDDEE